MEHADVNLNSMYDDFMRNLQDHIDSGMVQVNVNKSDNQNILDSFKDNSVAAVIVDGAHTLEVVEDDVTNWWPKVIEGGILVGDDVRLDSVRQGAFKAFEKHGIKDLSIIMGNEGWFAKIKHPNGTELEGQLKLVPGQNSMRLNG